MPRLTELFLPTSAAYDENDMTNPEGLRISPRAKLENVYLESYVRIHDAATITWSRIARGGTVHGQPSIYGSRMERHSNVREAAVVRGATLRPGSTVAANAVLCDVTLPSDASLRYNADVRCSSHVVTISGIGSEARTVTVYRAATRPGSDDPWTAMVVAGCFLGTAADLEERISCIDDAWEDYASDEALLWQRQYNGVIEIAKACTDVWNADAAIALSKPSRRYPDTALRHPNWDKRWVPDFSHYDNFGDTSVEIITFPTTQPASAV